MKTLKEKADKIAIQYIKAFERKYKIYFEFAVANNYFDVLNFADYYINFTDVKYCIDDNIDPELFFNWYDDNLESALKTKSTQTYINLPSYIMGLRHTDLK